MRTLNRLFLLLLASLLLAGNVIGADEAMVAQQKSPSFTGMFDLYQDNRAQGAGNFITTDFLLASYNLLLEKVAAKAEEQELLPRLQSLASTLQKQLVALPPHQPGRNCALGFISVVNSLAGTDGQLPADVADQVRKELKLIADHSSVAVSPVSGIQEDYTQYLPRGRYTRSEALGRYFLASLYAGRIGFALKDSKATGVTPAMADEQTAAALLISRTIMEHEELSAAYQKLNRLLTVIAGEADDLSPAELLVFADGEFEEKASLAATRSRIVAAARTAGRLPRILGGIVDKTRLEQGVSLAEATLSFRLLGQRFTPDSAAIQGLVFDRVTTYQGKGNPFTLAAIGGDAVRGFPTVFDLMAALGSAQSRRILAEGDETNFKGYAAGQTEAGRMMRRAAHNPRSLADMNLRLAFRLAAMPGSDSLNSAIGAWIQNRHAMLLYAKQSYTAVAKAIRIEPAYPERSNAYLEPAPDLYGDMIENLYLLGSVLEAPALRQQVEQFTAIIREVREVGYRQQEGEGSARDIAFLNDLDITIKEVTQEKDRPLVADIHTEPTSGLVLEEGIGFPRTVNHQGLRGGRFTCYEFKQPMDKRLTDEAWHNLLKTGSRPRSITAIISGI